MNHQIHLYHEYHHNYHQNYYTNFVIDYEAYVDNINTFYAKDLSFARHLSDVTFTVFPNPTSDFLNVSTSDNIESVKVFDMNGRLVLSNTYNTSNVKLDVMSLTNGYYTVLVNDVKPIKFIKN